MGVEVKGGSGYEMERRKRGVQDVREDNRTQIT